MVIIIVLVVSVILLALRRKKQKTIALEQLQEAVLESSETMIRNEAYMTNANVIPSSQNEAGNEPFKMTRNDAYSTVINEAYMTNINVIPTARNMAYVTTEFEDGNSLNREDMNGGRHTEPQAQTAHDQGIDDHSYDYVY